MPRYAAFLRAINLGRNRRISGADLRSLFEELGFDDVASFRTSGNVVFAAGGEPPAALTASIERGLAGSLGYEVAVFLRTASEVQSIAGHQPFAAPVLAASGGKLQVALLSKPPAPRVQEEVLALSTGEDRLAFGKRELYWLPSGGTQESDLDFKAIEKLVGPTTMRTKNTLEQLAAKYFAG